MSEDKRKDGLERRAFLRNMGVGAGAAAAALPLLATGAEAKETAEARSKRRYQESEHVKAFYRTNRY